MINVYGIDAFCKDFTAEEKHSSNEQPFPSWGHCNAYFVFSHILPQNQDNHLIRVLNENNTLNDANLLAMVVQGAHEAIRDMVPLIGTTGVSATGALNGMPKDTLI